MFSAHRKVAKAAALALSFALVTIGILRVSEAGFTAQTDNNSSGWSTGTVVLTDDDSGSALFSTANNGLLDGGQSLSKCIAVTYSGTLTNDLAIRMYATANGALAPYLNLTVDEGTGGGAGSCTGFNASTSLYTGTLADFATSRGTFGTGVGTWRPTTPPETHTYRLTMTVQNVPAAQAANATGTFTWEAGPVPTYASIIASDNPTGYWPFEDSGTTTADVTGHGYNATGAGTYTRDVPGRVKNAITFNGGAFITTPLPSAIRTVEAWVYPTASANSMLITERYGPSSNLKFQMYRLASGELYLWVTNEGYAGGARYAGNIPVNAWTHVAFVSNGPTITLYINGAPVSVTSPGEILGNSPGSPNASAYPLVIGWREAGADYGWIGKIDEVAAYATALAPERIAAHYAAGAP